MRGLIILSLGIFLLFAQMGFIFGCGSCDSSCDCGNSRCELPNLINSNPLMVWYHEDQISRSYDFSTTYLYPTPYTFTDSDCIHYSNSDCCQMCSYPCNCNEFGCDTCEYCCGDAYKCIYPTTTCRPWQTCYETSCGGGNDGCDCEEEFCKGWCMDNAPVYDGLASCSAASDGDWVISTFPKPHEYILDIDYHSANMGGGCYCNYYEIKNHHECDSTQITDSHPCQSRNCAPDFANGRNYCCPSGQCPHLGLNVEITNGLPKYNNLVDSIDQDLYCYSNGAVIQYQGDSLKCDNGMWNFVTGESGDYTDNCGKTIHDYQLFFNKNPMHPDAYNPSSGYQNSYLVYPVSFPGETKDVVAYIMPGEEFVQIELSKNLYGFDIGGDGTQKIIKQYTDGAVATFSLFENIQGEIFDYHVDCYTPDGYGCNYKSDECWSSSYCSQDNPSNIAGDENEYYCCPKGTCAHSESGAEAICYEEGGHALNIDEEICLWECKDEIWGKRELGEICSRDCDCAGSEDSGTELFCKRILYDQRDSICCPEGKCGLKTGVCVGDNEVAQSKEYKNCVCQDGTWHCRNTIVEDKNSRILFSKDMNTYKTTLKLNTYFDKLAHVKIMLFFDKKNYDGEINIIGLDGCEINKNIAIEERNNIFEGDVLAGEYTCELEISAPGLLEDQYFFYTGNALILSYTTLNLNTVCRDGVLEGSEECELNDLTTCKFLAPNTCTKPSCSPFCTCEFELVCDGSTCEKDSLDYLEHCAVCEDGRCDSNEDSLICCEDCGSECGDGVCNCDETVTSCADDCL